MEQETKSNYSNSKLFCKEFKKSLKEKTKEKKTLTINKKHDLQGTK